MKALFITGDSLAGDVNSNSSQYRCIIPANYLNHAGHDVTVVDGAIGFEVKNERFLDVDQVNFSSVPETVLVERNISPERIEKLKLSGARRIVLTFDDAYFHLNPIDTGYEYWSDPKNKSNFVLSLGMVDEVVVPSHVLADDFSSFCKKISVVPNFLDDDLWLRASPDPDRISERIVIGWGGSHGHHRSWQLGNPCISALRQVIEDFSGEVILAVYGPAAINGLREAGVPFVERPLVDFHAWPNEVAGFDVGIAPLAGTYDRRRSNLKALEYGILGIPCVVSDLEPYADCPWAYHAKTRKDWIACLLKAIVESRQENAGFLSNGAERYLMSKNVRVYERILWPNGH